MLSYRTDVGSLKPATRTADGRLIAEAHFTRAGILEYPDRNYPGGIRRELRPESEVFDSKSMESAQNLVATQDHPPRMITAKTAKTYMVGMTGDRVMRDDDHLKGKVTIANAPTIDKMDSGDDEVSLGYVCVVDNTPGVDPKYGRYDAVQRVIRYNHLAVALSRGDARAGSTARVRMDSRALTTDELDELDDAKTFGVDARWRSDARGHQQGDAGMADEKLMENLRALEASLKTAEAERDQYKERADSVTRERDALTGKLSVVERERDDAKASLASHSTAVETAAIVLERERADKAEKLVARFDSTLDTAVRERAAVLNTGTIIMGPEFRMDDLSNRDIKVQVCKRLDSNASVGKDVSDATIDGIFQTLVSGHVKNARSLARISEVARAQDASGGAITQQDRADSIEAKRRAMKDRWKQPLPNDPRARKEA